MVVVVGVGDATDATRAAVPEREASKDSTFPPLQVGAVGHQLPPVPHLLLDVRVHAARLRAQLPTPHAQLGARYDLKTKKKKN